MIEQERHRTSSSPKEEDAPEDHDICPHCGSVLDLARAMESERSVLRSRSKVNAKRD